MLWPVQDDQASINVVRRAQELEKLDLTNYASTRAAWERELYSAADALSTAAGDPSAGGQGAHEAVTKLGTGSFGLY